MNSKREKKKVAEFFAIVLAMISVVLFLGGIFDIYARTIQVHNSAEKNYEIELNVNSDDLKAVADKYAHVEKLTGVEKVALNKKISDIKNSNLDSITKAEALKSLGEITVYEDDINFASVSGSIDLNKPTITYNSKNGLYKIEAKGGLPASAIKDDIPLFVWSIPSAGDEKNIGGVDGVVLSITNLVQSKNNVPGSGLCVDSGYAVLNGYRDSGSNYSEISYVSVTNNDNYGSGYEVQDKVKFTSVKNYFLVAQYTWVYNASGIACVVYYDRQFADYECSVKLGYSHTWSSTHVNSIGVSNNGASFGWSSANNRWKAFSSATRFTN